MQDQELILKLTQALYDKKADQIVALKVAHLTVLCDYMVIASGRSAAQVSALADSADEFMTANGIELRRSEGMNDGKWAVMDYGHIIVHIFHRDERAYYNLDRLWTDGTNALTLPFDQTVND